ncbi:MAG: glycosyltransferase [Acidobacteria bacterium]|nr:glycosyltransferase [Acidobacteriota bacterium]
MNQRLTLVVPCYNEAGRLDIAAFERALHARPALDLLFVDDGSRDGTGQMLAALVARSAGRAGVLTLAANSGKGEAVRQGVLAALDRAPDWVGYWDADLATPLDALADFAVVSGRPGVEVIIGSRVKLLGRNITRQAHRHYAGRVFATAASLALGIPVYDTQCGAKLFRAGARTRELFQAPFASRWVFDVELLDRLLAQAGGDRRRVAEERIYELALRSWHHQPGSKLRPRDILRAALDLWRVYRRRVR